MWWHFTRKIIESFYLLQYCWRSISCGWSLFAATVFSLAWLHSCVTRRGIEGLSSPCSWYIVPKTTLTVKLILYTNAYVWVDWNMSVNLVKHTGGCHCGKIRFEVLAKPEIKAYDCKLVRSWNYVNLQFLQIFKYLMIYHFIYSFSINSCTICAKKGLFAFYVPKENFKLLQVSFICMHACARAPKLWADHVNSKSVCSYCTPDHPSGVTGNIWPYRTILAQMLVNILLNLYHMNHKITVRDLNIMIYKGFSWLCITFV